MNYHDIPDPDQTTEGRSKPNAESSPLSPSKQAKKYRPKGADLEPPVSTIARFAGRLIDRLTGKAYSADEIAANNANVVTAIQENPAAVVAAISAITTLTDDTYVLTAADNGKIFLCETIADIVIETPVDDPGVPFSCAFIQNNSGGAVAFFASTGTTLNSYNDLNATAGVHAWASLIRTGVDTYNLSGALA